MVLTATNAVTFVSCIVALSGPPYRYTLAAFAEDALSGEAGEHEEAREQGEGVPEARSPPGREAARVIGGRHAAVLEGVAGRGSRVRRPMGNVAGFSGGPMKTTQIGTVVVLVLVVVLLVVVGERGRAETGGVPSVVTAGTCWSVDILESKPGQGLKVETVEGHWVKAAEAGGYSIDGDYWINFDTVTSFKARKCPK